MGTCELTAACGTEVASVSKLGQIKKDLYQILGKEMDQIGSTEFCQSESKDPPDKLVCKSILELHAQWSASPSPRSINYHQEKEREAVLEPRYLLGFGPVPNNTVPDAAVVPVAVVTVDDHRVVLQTNDKVEDGQVQYGTDKREDALKVGAAAAVPSTVQALEETKAIEATATLSDKAMKLSDVAAPKSKMMHGSRKKSKRTKQMVSILGNRGDRIQDSGTGADLVDAGDGSDQNKKIRGIVIAEEPSDAGGDGGKEATRNGAPGQLVGAEDGTRQEP